MFGDDDDDDAEVMHDTYPLSILIPPFSLSLSSLSQAAAEKLKQERIAAYADKKSKSIFLQITELASHNHIWFTLEPTLIAKSNIILDVKPWGDDTDMKEMERCVRGIEADGLIWAACKGHTYCTSTFKY